MQVADTTTLWMGRLKSIQPILLLPQQAAINLDMALSSLHCQKEIYYNQHAASPLPLLSHLCLSSFSFTAPVFPANISSF